MNRNTSALTHQDRVLSRRSLLQAGAAGIGWAGLAQLITQGRSVQAGAGESPSRVPATMPKAKRLVLMFQHGGPSQIDLFDPKPALEKNAGQPIPGGVEAFFDKKDSGKCLPSPFRFSRHGESGMEFSELLPRMAECADDFCMVRSLHTVVNDHEGALRHFQTGKPQIGRPTIGSWLTYALGTPNPNLPAYVVLSDPSGDQLDGMRNWSSGFLPALYQGTPLRSDGTPLFDLTLPMGVTEEMQREQLSLLESLNRRHQKRFSHLSELDARIANNTLAGNVRDEVVNALDLSKETAQTQEMYGMNHPAT